MVRGVSILDKIIQQRKERLKEKAEDFSSIELAPSRRSLVDALQTSQSGLILECKQSSPSRGLLTDHYQPDDIANSYAPFASAVSVLTEPDYFSGSLDDLKQVRLTVDLPILCKDFVVDISQLYAARAAGADVILLMLSVVSNDFWLQCYEITEQLGLDIITEISNQEELDRALQLPSKILGINNRDLHTLKTDISVTEKLAKNIPPDRLIISESGISSHRQLRKLAPLVDGFLIGSGLMQSESIDQAIRKLVFGEVKICGLTNRHDADLAWHSGASYGGIIFTTASSRHISVELAFSICNDQPMPMVGVFMDQPIGEIVGIAKKLKLAAVQLHGNESAHTIKELRQLLPEQCQIWKTMTCSEIDDNYPSIQDTVKLISQLNDDAVDRILIDTPKDNRDHNLYSQDSNYQHLVANKNIMLAGKLSIDQPIQILANYQLSNQQAGFDLCSAIEISPGKKDPVKLKKLFDKLQPETRKSMDSTSQSSHKVSHYFSSYGGMFVPEILVPALQQLENEYHSAMQDPEFINSLESLLENYAGRPTPVYRCLNITKGCNADIYLKREDLLHGGAHKTNQVLAQALLAKRMGKKRIIAETGAGQHGVATAMVCALLDLDVVIYMGEKDIIRQQPNVQRMQLLGAKVVSVTAGSSSLKDAINEALRDWTSSYEDTHYLIGTVAGPAPFPDMVRNFQQIIGIEARKQVQQQAGRLPDMAIACVGGGSNAIGLFQAFLADDEVKLVGVEAAGKGLGSQQHGATMNLGKEGIFQGCLTKIIQSAEGQIQESYSISAGLDYPGVGPQHVALQESGAASYVAITDEQALDASLLLTRKEGIIPALESSHALAYAIEVATNHPSDAERLCLLVNLSGRGDKDLITVLNALEERKNAE